MPEPFHKIINFPSFDTKNGILCMIQSDKKKDVGVPFKIKKVLSITGMKDSDKRGGHTHHKTHQILIATSGKCTVDLDDGKNKSSVVLDSSNKGLLLYPYVWHVMHSFAPSTSLLVVADREYDEKEYIRDYNEFKKWAMKKGVMKKAVNSSTSAKK